MSKRTIQFEAAGPRGVPYMSDDGATGTFVTNLLSMLDRQRDAHPSERADCIGLHPWVFDQVYQHVHGDLTPDRNAVTAMRRVGNGDDYETIWLHPEPDIIDVTEVLFGRRRVE